MGIKEELSEKIDSEEKWLEFMRRNSLMNSNVGKVTLPQAMEGIYANHPWWLRREVLRTEYDVYQTSSVLQRINSHWPAIQVHVSTEDPKLVAYTPDREAGLRDKQVRITLGRLLQRLYPYEADHTLSDLVSDHESEVSTEVEFLRTEEEIEYAYTHGPSSCMNKSFRPFPHPSRVYAAPNLALAILRKRGTISARCLVYDASPTDKRMIRCYGDPALAKKLTRLGYTVGSLEGAVLNRITYEGRTILPYIDGNGGTGSVNSSTVVILDGQLRVCNAVQRKALAGKTYIATNTSGYITGLQDVSSAEFVKTDDITGESLNLLVDDVKYVYDGRVILRTKQTVVTTPAWLHKSESIYDAAELVDVLPEVPTFEHKSKVYVDNALIRKRLGFVKLDPEFYPDETEWFTIPSWSSSYKQMSNGKYARAEDVVYQVDSSSSAALVHRSKVVKSWIKLHSRERGEDSYATDPSIVKKTDTNRKVVPGFHSVVQSFYGSYIFERSAKNVRIFRNSVWLPRKLVMTRQVYMDYFYSKENLYDIYTLMDTYFGRIYLPAKDGVSLTRKYSAMDNTQKAQAFEMLSADYGTTGESGTLVYLAKIAHAEACAVEAPEYLQPEPTVTAVTTAPEQTENDYALV